MSEGNFKIKCIKDDIGWLTKDKIYEFKNGRTKWDNGLESQPYKNYNDFYKACVGWEDYLIEEKDDYNWMFNLQEFKNKKIVINCETEEEAEQLFDILIKNGISRWKSGSYLASVNYFKNNNKYTCYSIIDDNLTFGNIEFFNNENYTIYKFSEIDFSQVWNKDSIEDASLHKINFERVKSITKEQLEERGLKTGDIVFLDNGYKGIVYGKSIVFTGKIGWDKIKNIKNKIIEFIPVEIIEEYSEFTAMYGISQLINNNDIDEDLHDLTIKIQEEKKQMLVCKVEFAVESTKLKEFILNSSNGEGLSIGDVVECDSKQSGWQYARVKDIESKELTDNEIKQYKVCRKLTE